MRYDTNINQNMTPEMRRYFKKVEEDLGIKLYFYGSIHRYDYFPNESDIDIDIFAENIDSMSFQLKQYFHVKSKKVKKIMTYINGIPIHGYKFAYFEPRLRLKCEFSVYPTRHKQLILKEHMKKTNVPFIGIFLLVILKTLFYSLKIIDLKSYKITKKHILSHVIGYTDPPFIIFNSFR